MASCPKCGRRPIKRKLGIRKCKHCGVLPDTTPSQSKEMDS